MASAQAVAAEPNYLTTRGVADRFHTVESTVRYWRAIGYGPKGVKVGRRVLYPEAEVRRFETELAAAAGAQIA